MRTFWPRLQVKIGKWSKKAESLDKDLNSCHFLSENVQVKRGRPAFSLAVSAFSFHDFKNSLVYFTCKLNCSVVSWSHSFIEIRQKKTKNCFYGEMKISNLPNFDAINLEYTCFIIIFLSWLAKFENLRQFGQVS